jgi:anthranilate synthase component 1
LTGLEPSVIYENAKSGIREIKKLLSPAVSYNDSFNFTEGIQTDNNELFDLIERAKQNIINGDVFQLVLSKRFSCGYEGNLFNLYRALRIINPSPYMYYMEFNEDLVIIGTSPEDLLKVTDRKATILPIAGTRRRGRDESEDKILSDELMSDPKEISEHTMLVDLARNDLGRVCKFGTVKVTEEMKIHYYSHVMHIVSRVEGMLKDNMDCIDALKASFPAGTVTGAPKIRAVQLLSGYEKIKRNIYAGAIGYIDYKGNLDMCIAIRTFFADKENIIWQAGAGIVADSIPELESKEIQNKSAVLVNALKFAEVIDENSCN